MLTIIGALLGLLGSLAPEVLKYLRQKSDQAHELEMYRLQMEMAKLQGEIKLEELNATADIEEVKALYQHATPKNTGSRLIDALLALFSHTVRPIITYAFMATYIAVKYAIYMSYTQAGYSWQQSVQSVWNAEDFAIFATIMAFWFGGRFMKYSFEKFK